MGIDSRDYYRPQNRFSFFPPVIKNLLIINVVVFLILEIGKSLIIGNYNLALLIRDYFGLVGLYPDRSLGDVNFFPWQLVTYQFLHADFSHIFWNMFALWMFGMELENIWGSSKFLIYYLISGVGGGLMHLLLSDSTGITVGASGCIYGILIASAMFFPNRPIYVYFLLPVKTKYFVAFFILKDLFMLSEVSMVAHLAHLGGALTGFLFIMLDSGNKISISSWINSYKRNKEAKPSFRRPFGTATRDKDVSEAEFYDINDKKEDEISQEDIDRILDKISSSGYQNLTEKEKKILFEASKKK